MEEEDDLDNVFEDLGEVSPETEKNLLQSDIQQTQTNPKEGTKSTDDLSLQQLAAIMKSVNFKCRKKFISMV